MQAAGSLLDSPSVVQSRAAFGNLCLSSPCQPRNAWHWNVGLNMLECRAVWAASINVLFQGKGQLVPMFIFFQLSFAQPCLCSV